MAARWSKTEIKILNDNYKNTNKIKMIKLLPNRTHRSIERMAQRLKLRKIINLQCGYLNKRNKVEILLEDESLTKYYWLGFMLADGCFSKDILIINLSKKDKKHLKKLQNYLHIENMCEIIDKNGYEKCSISARDKRIIPLIKQKYDIHNNKTENPPNISNYNLTDEQFLSLFAGFIDGDGSIYGKTKYSKSKIKISDVHSAWLDNLIYFEDRLFNILGFKKDKQYSHIKNNKNATFGIFQFAVIQEFKKRLLIFNIPLLERKWNKI